MEYDRNEALAFMQGKLTAAGALAGRTEEFLRAALQADLEYMEKSGVLEGSAYYDDDDAFEYLCESVARAMGLREGKGMDDMEDLIDSYMDLQQAYMEEKGLLSWE